MKTLPNSPNRKETVYGWRYLAFQILFLGALLSYALEFLGISLNDAQLNGLFFAINFAVVLLLFRRFLWAELQYALDHIPRVLLTALLGFLALEAITLGMGWVISQRIPGYANMNDQGIASLAREDFLLMALGTVVLVPLTEEVLFRGVVFGSLMKGKPWIAYAASVCLFSLVHFHGYIGIMDPLTMLVSFLQYVPAGIGLAFCYHHSGSLFAPVLIHAAFNAMGILAMR